MHTCSGRTDLGVGIQSVDDVGGPVGELAVLATVVEVHTHKGVVLGEHEAEAILRLGCTQSDLV
ncbi:hypothetical protein [Haloarchaeobius litoreus]|uniref:Uncharacterized protein n=1 Tax=Haloarchaeobius litoreus TaxID=755306 RepID=A0ABD6DLV0_9EURY